MGPLMRLRFLAAFLGCLVLSSSVEAGLLNLSAKRPPSVARSQAQIQEESSSDAAVTHVSALSGVVAKATRPERQLVNDNDTPKSNSDFAPVTAIPARQVSRPRHLSPTCALHFATPGLIPDFLFGGLVPRDRERGSLHVHLLYLRPDLYLSPAEELADTQRTRSSGQAGATSGRDQEEARATLEQTLGALDTIGSEAHDHDPRRVEAEAHLSSFGARQQRKDAAASAAAEPAAGTGSVHDAIEAQLARIRAEDNDSSEDDALAVRRAPPPSYQVDTPRPSPRTNRTRRVPHPVLIGPSTPRAVRGTLSCKALSAAARRRARPAGADIRVQGVAPHFLHLHEVSLRV